MSTERKKILFVITKSNWGGAQRYVFDLATSLAHSYDVVVAAGGEGRLADMLREQHIRVIPLPHLSRDISLRGELHAARDLYQLLRIEKPDILHLNSSKAGGLGALMGRLAQVPIIIFTAHAWAWNEERPFYARAVIALLHWSTVLLAHRTIAVSHALYDQMAHFPLTKKRMRIVHPGITPLPRIDKTQARATFIARAPQLANLLKVPWIVTIGELHPVKGYRFALKAIDAIQHDVPCVYIIIGTGQDKDTIDTYITSHVLRNTVFTMGHIQDAAALLSAFDLFVLPSLSEAFGYVLLEAGAADIPIVASAVGGIPEIIQPGMGTLVPPKNVELLRDAIENILHDPHTQKTYSLALRTAILEHFTKERMVAETEDVYDS